MIKGILNIISLIGKALAFFIPYRMGVKSAENALNKDALKKKKKYENIDGKSKVKRRGGATASALKRVRKRRRTDK